MDEDERIKVGVEKVLTAGMKRRGVVRVLHDALHDAQREFGEDRVVGIFGLIVRENGGISLCTAVTGEELRKVMAALPTALQRVAVQVTTGSEVGN